MKLSYEQIRELLRKTLKDKGECEHVYIMELFEDHMVYEDNDILYRRTYAIAEDESVSLGERAEVEKKTEYVDVKSAVRISAAAVDKDSEDYGIKWRVRVLDFGIDGNNTYYAKEAITAAVGMFEGAKVFQLSEAQHQAKPHPHGKSTTDLVGWLSDVKTDATGLVADLNVLKSAEPLRAALVDSFERGNPDLLGLSVDMRGLVSRKKIDGKQVRYLHTVKSVTVDVVYDPAAGGKFLQLTAAQKQSKEEPSIMLEKLLAALKGSNPQAYATLEGKINAQTVTEDEVVALLASNTVDLDGLEVTVQAAVKQAIEEDRLAASQAGAGSPGDDEGSDDDDTMSDDLKASKKINEDTRIVACGIRLDAELNKSELNDLSKDRLTKAFTGKVFEVDDLRAAIQDEKTFVDTITSSGAVTDPGSQAIVVGADGKVTMFDDFFDGKVHSIKACYANLTGDNMVEGNVKASRLTASMNSTTFAEVLGDSIRRKMLAEYNAAGLDDYKKICDIVPLSDFRTNHRTRMGGYGDLPVVPEGDAYASLATPSDEEATYSATKKGGIEELTREMIKNDDSGVVRRIPVKLARAAKRTLHKFVFDMLKDNGAIYDAAALFHASHNNLGSAALDATSLIARHQAMLQQTELDSDEVLGIAPKYLIVPTNLNKTAYDLVAAPRNSDFNPTSADFIRTLQMEVIVVPYWADANNWFLSANPLDIPGIELGFIDGKENPEIFIQDQPNVGSMFSNDKLTYKIRHEYGGVVNDYRGFDGSIVA